MKADIVDMSGKKTKTIALPSQFTYKVRQDVIRKAFLIFESNQRQPYGAFPKAGTRSSARISKRRRDFRGCYGHGISRVPRKVLWRRGTQFGWVGAFAPGTVSGRRAHPPKSSKDFSRKLNKKEAQLAMCSALSATMSMDNIKERGHKITQLNVVVDSKIESLSKTKDVLDTLKKLNLTEELKRVSKRKVRAGIGKMRGRRYKTKTGPLLVVSKKCKLEEAGINILGVDVCQVKNLNISLLAPGGVPGRLTIFTEDSIKELQEKNLFKQKKNKRSNYSERKTKKTKTGPKKAVKKVVKKITKKVIKK